MISPIQTLREATRAVPAVKYALGVGGILATVALLYSFRIDPRVAFVGTIVVLVLMGVLVVFARMAALSGARLHFPAMVFTWFVLLVFMATTIGIFTSVFFKVPVNLQYWLAPPSQTVSEWKADDNPTHSLLQRINGLQSSQEKILALLNFDLKHSLGLKARDELSQFAFDLEFETFTIGDKALIAMYSARRLSCLVFVNMRDTTLTLEDSNFGAGIVKIQIIGPSAKSRPNAIVEVEYTSIYGTGTYATSVKLYALTDGLVLLSLVKPQFEHNSGWGAFKSNSVEFKTKNIFEINPNTLAYEIRTIGIAAIGADNKSSDPIKGPDGTEFKAVRDLPDELYVWNPLSRQFEQREGRVVAGQDLLTSVYSDFADPKGKWFRKPAQLPSKSRLERLYPKE